MMRETKTGSRYAVGLPLVEERDLSPSERHRLRQATKCQSAIVLLSLAVFLGGGAVLLLPSLGLAVPWNAFPLVTTWTWILLWALSLRARRDVPLLLALRRARARNRVLVFTGNLDERLLLHDSTVARLASHSALSRDPLEEQTVSILVGADLAWSVNGVPTRGWVRVPVRQPAHLPDFSAVAAEWARPVSGDANATVSINYRDLTSAEHSEIAARLRRIARSLIGPFVVIALVVVMFIAAVQQREWLLAPMFAAFLGVVAYRLGPGLRLLARILRDAKQRLLVIVVTEYHEASFEADSRDAAALGRTVAEFLPHSRVEWTRNGEPAPWRRAQ